MTGSRRGCLPAEGTVAQNRAGTSYRRSLDQPWVAIWRPLLLKFCIRSYHPQATKMVIGFLSKQISYGFDNLKMDVYLQFDRTNHP